MPDDHYAKLLDRLIPFCRRLVESCGAFEPFAEALTPDGKLRVIADLDSGKWPAQDEMLLAINQRLKKGVESGRFVAFCRCRQVMTKTAEGRQTRAIRFHLESPDNRPLNAFLPYHRIGPGKAEFSTLFMVEGSWDVLDPPKVTP